MNAKALFILQSPNPKKPFGTAIVLIVLGVFLITKNTWSNEPVVHSISNDGFYKSETLQEQALPPPPLQENLNINPHATRLPDPNQDYQLSNESNPNPVFDLLLYNWNISYNLGSLGADGIETIFTKPINLFIEYKLKPSLSSRLNLEYFKVKNTEYSQTTLGFLGIYAFEHDLYTTSAYGLLGPSLHIFKSESQPTLVLPALNVGLGYRFFLSRFNAAIETGLKTYKNGNEGSIKLLVGYLF